MATAQLTERRYLGLVELARIVNVAHDWKQLASGISAGLERSISGAPEDPPGVRLWAITAEGFEESARYPTYHEFGPCPPRELRRAARAGEPIETAAGATLIGLHSGGATLGVLEVSNPAIDRELIIHAAPVIASRVSLLAGQGVGGVLIDPGSISGAGDVASLMAAFAAEAERQLSHDRLSAYLLTCQGRAFERFAVATSSTVDGEGVIIPFEDIGLRHVVINNRPLVSDDLATDPRVVGREDRLIAAAGFHGLLSVPLRVQERPIGVLNFVSRTPGFYRDEDIPIGQQIADQVAGFINNLHTQQRMRAVIRDEAAERERTRVGRDIYHVVAQNVPAIVHLAETLEQALPDLDAETKAKLGQVSELANGTLADVRRAIADLLPREFDALTLEEAVSATLAGLGASGPATSLEVRGDTSRISAAARRGVCRIVQEAVTNTRLHAQAETLKVRIECERDLSLTVTDDGTGFDADRLAASAGMGLEHMRERARALGGTLTIESTPGAGTQVRLELLGVSDAEDDHARGQSAEDGIASPNPQLRLFIIDHHPLARAGLLHLAESVPDLRVVGEAARTSEARHRLRRLRPDIVLLDGHLPVTEVEALIRDLRTELPLTHVVITFEAPTGYEPALTEAGANSYLRKTAGAAELAEVVRAAALGSGSESGELPASAETSPLSLRERSILFLMAAGRTNTEIGLTLFLATKTVERQVATIVRKLGARNRAHAAAIAVARGIVDPEATA